MTRVLALVPYPTGRVPGQRYRIEQWARQLREHEIDISYSAFLSRRTMDILYERGHALEKICGTLAGYRRRAAELGARMMTGKS